MRGAPLASASLAPVAFACARMVVKACRQFSEPASSAEKVRSTGSPGGRANFLQVRDVLLLHRDPGLDRTLVGLTRAAGAAYNPSKV